MTHSRFVSFVSAAAAFLLVACGTATPTGSKYPYAPQFVEVTDKTAYLLPEPADIGSKEYKRGIEAVLTRQATLTAADIVQLKAEDAITPELIVLPVLGNEFTADRFPATYDLLRRTGSDAWRISDTIQDHWKRQRPWIADARVKLHVNPITRPTYPSGHTVTTAVWARVLGDLMPCQENALLARANEIGYHRVDAGAHFPADVEAGKRLARVLYFDMTENEDYQAALEAARNELNHALRYGIPNAQEDAKIDTGFIARCGGAPMPERVEAAH